MDILVIWTSLLSGHGSVFFGGPYSGLREEEKGECLWTGGAAPGWAALSASQPILSCPFIRTGDYYPPCPPALSHTAHQGSCSPFWEALLSTPPLPCHTRPWPSSAGTPGVQRGEHVLKEGLGQTLSTLPRPSAG